MDFELSDDQQLLRETVRRFFAERAPLDLVRDQQVPDDVWRGLAEMGVLGALVAPEHGGSGMTMVDVGVVLEEAGRACFPGPLEASAVGATSAIALAGSAAQQERWLPGLADGSVVGTFAFGEPPHLARVPAGLTADLLVVVDTDRLAVSDLGAAGVDRVTGDSVDLTRPVADITVVELDPLPRGAPDAVAALRDRLLTAAAVDGLGAAQRSMEMAVAHAGERHQFGRPIGSFQAVQHLCADMLVDVEIGRAACYYALWACDAGDARERSRAATMAKAWASDAFHRVAAACIQVHGGIGFTWEHDAHLPYKRLLSLQHRFGGTDHQLLDLADQVF